MSLYWRVVIVKEKKLERAALLKKTMRQYSYHPRAIVFSPLSTIIVASLRNRGEMFRIELPLHSPQSASFVTNIYQSELTEKRLNGVSSDYPRIKSK